jgi:putative ABC transport system permease protein
MLNLESVFSSLKALVIGVPLGILGSYGVYLAIGFAGELDFRVPWSWVVSAVLGVFIITWVTMRYAAGKLRHQNIIETIRSGSGV